MINVVAIDDEPIALSIIEEYCRRYGDINIETFTSPIAGMECVEKTHPDLVFMDIEMNSHNGMELARQLPEGICLIFTTAYSEYALEGFNADAVDFLHKPIFYQRFERAIDKALKWIGVGADRNGASQQQKPSVITLRSEHKNVVINLDDIVCVEAMDNYVKVYRKNMPMVVSQITMKEMEDILPEERFIRVHRSFIVGLHAIDRYSNRQLILQPAGRVVPVGRKYSACVSEFLDNLNNIKEL